MICPPSSSATGTSVTRPSISAASQTSFSVRKGLPICRSPSNSAYMVPPARNPLQRFRNGPRSQNLEDGEAYKPGWGQCGLLSHVIPCTYGWRTVLVSLDIAFGRAHARGIHRSIFSGAVNHAGLLHAGLGSRPAVL